MTIASFQHQSSYLGQQIVEMTLNPDGSLSLEPVGYYEDTIVIPSVSLRELGLVVADSAVKQREALVAIRAHAASITDAATRLLILAAITTALETP